MMKKLNELFEVTYGNKLDLNKMTLSTFKHGGVNFVGRSSQNHGVSATVLPIFSIKPYEAGLITVALGGTKLLSSFVQTKPFYTAQNVAILKPLKEMSFFEKVFACIAIRHNRFRYSAFGREANRTLRELLIPDVSEFPSWVHHLDVNSFRSLSAPVNSIENSEINLQQWKRFTLGELFEIRKGKRLTKQQIKPGDTPFIGSIDSNNGLSFRIAQAPIHDGNTITVNYNGSVAEAFYQAVPFWASDDVNVLYPRFRMNSKVALFFIAIIRREKYRYSYGRKWHLDRMRDTIIKLPSTNDGEPDYKFMEHFINALPYSSQLA